MNIDETWRAICEDPDDDGLRLRYADLVEAADPEWAQFIRAQIDAAARVRRGEYHVDYGNPSGPQAERWGRNIAMFTHSGNPNRVEFFRGFPAKIDMQPEVFIENAELIFRLAPIQHIQFRTPCDDDWQPLLDDDGIRVEFPLDEVLARPELARLDRIILRDVRLRPNSAAKLAACPYLTRCLYLDLTFSLLTEEGVVALAEGALTRKMLVVAHELPTEYGEHRVRERVRDMETAPEVTRHVFGQKGKELEEQYGYIPWLHDDNRPSDIDIRWYANQGLVPKFPAGSKPPRDEWYEMPPPIHHGKPW
jgi:uncharacterized protein (TIGR02996 family)